MRALVVHRFNGKTKLLTENKQIVILSPEDSAKVNPAMRLNDLGTLVRHPNGQLKFIIDAEEQIPELTPDKVHDIILRLEDKSNERRLEAHDNPPRL